MMVAGFELTNTTSYPSSRSALHALGPRVIKLASLPNDDGARANDQDLFDVISFGHARIP